MKEFFKDVGLNCLKFLGALLLLNAVICTAGAIIAPMIVVPYLILDTYGKCTASFIGFTVFMIVYWSVVSVVGSAIWRKITGRPKLKRGQIYIEHAESGYN